MIHADRSKEAFNKLIDTWNGILAVTITGLIKNGPDSADLPVAPDPDRLNDYLGGDFCV